MRGRHQRRLRGEGRSADQIVLRNPEDIEAYSPLTDETGKRSFSGHRAFRQERFCRAHRRSGNQGRGRRAEGVTLHAHRDQLPSLPDDEFYHADLVGLTVVDTGGTELGRVKSVQNHGAADLLEVALPDSSATVLLPFTKVAVPTVDLASGRIVADPPEGLWP